MSDHTTLTDTERATLAAWWESDWPSDGADVLDTLAAVVESIVAARVAAARAEEHDNWLSRVRALRAKHLRNVLLNINGRADIYDGFLADLRALIEGADGG